MEPQVKQIKQLNDQDLDSFEKRAPLIGVRHLQSLLLFLCVFCNFLLRVNLSVTIVAMNPVVNSTDYLKEVSEHIPVFNWNSNTRSMLLSSFFVGYLLANFPASVLGCRFDNKTLLSGSMAITSLLAIVSPLTVLTLDAPALIVIRFAQGLSSAFMFPMIHGIMAKWAPPHERSRLLGFIVSGIQLGTMTTLAVSGILSGSSFGWPSVYYVSGGAGLAWTFAWMLLGAESLSKHRYIGQAEKDFVQASLANTVSHDLRLSDIPWKSVLTSLPVWATTIAHTGYNWGFWLLLTEMPTFISTVLRFDIKKNGMLSALPYMAMFVLQFPVSYGADMLNKRNVTTMTVSRKMWNTMATWGGAAGLVTLGYMDDAALTIALYVCIVAIGCTSNAGFKINHLDLSPNYAGLLMGITNAAGSTGGIVAPLFVGFIIKDQTSIVEWRLVFISGAVVLFISNLFFIIFGSGKTQPWNSLKSNDAPKLDNVNQEVENVG